MGLLPAILKDSVFHSWAVLLFLSLLVTDFGKQAHSQMPEKNMHGSAVARCVCAVQLPEFSEFKRCMAICRYVCVTEGMVVKVSPSHTVGA